jgi:prepilin-type N-terminal cleavage/methylation domain-containing protein
MARRAFPSKTVRRGGFTLIELLVVIGIIALLAAIVVPVYTRAMESGRQADCMAHLHALAIALKSYQADWNGYPPPQFFEEPTDPTRTGEWLGAFSVLWTDNYATNYVALRCRDDTEEGDHPEKTYSSYNSWYNYLGYDRNGNPITTDWSGFYSPVPADRAEFMEAAFQSARTFYAPEGVVLRDERGRTLWKPDPVNPAAPGTYTSAFPGLINPLAPGETIVTHCTWHRNFFGRGQTKDLALRLEGNVQRIVVDAYSNGSTGENGNMPDKWQVQPVQ